MKNDYADYLEALENKRVYEALNLTFAKVFPDIIEECENEKESAELFISFLRLIETRSASSTPINFQDFAFSYYYTDFCDALFGMIDSYSVNDAKIAYEILKTEINNTITDLIIQGLQNGTILPSDLEENTENGEE